MNTDKFAPLEAFTERQFSRKATLPQTIFDCIFGIVAPSYWVSIWYSHQFNHDSDVWTEPAGSGDVLFFLYFSGLVVLAVLSLTIWIATRRFALFLSGFFAGLLLLLVPGIFLLFPICIMAIGFGEEFFPILPAPFTAFVYIRNSVRVIRPTQKLRTWKSVYLPVLGFVLFFALPAVPIFTVCYMTDSQIDRFLAINESEFEIHLEEFDGAKWWFHSDRIIDKYFDIALEREKCLSAEEKENRLIRLRIAYSKIEGKEMDCSRYYESYNPWNFESQCE